ncbi:putative cullulin 3 protein [Phaeoacremonium minimum UCRPA7]|uniref:Putative cullulin 3 protein n=1 Tax=Phaeoacremonium minimum (strain UCR-PA7) TaxID=1286976 RepID=R8BMI7_PHAM7|nr:putative cullulin 3 protein [Phaeoacremonium minimum UCRPA7]EOO00480.1 putative cullulin 3 protein [Phaeoacremonium minimum UCRPA7]
MMHRPGGKIRPPRRPIAARGETNEFETCWNTLKEALVDIHNRNAGKLSFEQLYRASYKIVLKKRGDELYDKVKLFEEQWFHDKVIPAIQGLLSRNLITMTVDGLPGTTANERRQMGEKFLRGLKDSWESHNFSMNMIADILMYLDRGYTTDTKRPSIFTTTIGLFRDNILRSRLNDIGYEGLLTGVFNAVALDLINMEREGDVIDRNLLRKCISMFEDLYETDDENDDDKLYLTTFEPEFLDASRRFYRQEATRLVRDSDAGTWLRHTQRRLFEEQERCETTISKLSAANIAKVVDEELISSHLEEFLALEGSGLKSMIDNDRLEDLTILYQLVSRVDAKKEVLKNLLQRRVVELGLEIEKVLKNTDFSVQQTAAEGDDGGEGAEKAKPQPLTGAAQTTAAAIRWVDDVLQLKDKFDRIWTQCFDEDLVIQTALTKSFSDFINMFQRSSEYVSLFIDDNLKRGIRGKTEIEVDAVLEKAVTLIRFLQDKDMFERYYQKHLARRLLHGKSESQDVEKQMISRMKQEVGNHFTTKFEGMFKDMDISRDLAEDYRSHIRGLGDVDRKNIELSISVLTSNNWPPEVMGRSSQLEDGSRVECNYPAEIKSLQQSFFKYYLKDRSGRVLTWVGSAGTADIKCVFPKIPGKETGPLSKERRYDLNVSTHGMIVLMLFNDLAEGESLSFEEIQAETNISPNELSRALASLSVAPKARVLTKEPSTKAVRPGDKFMFNTSFVSKTIKIKAPTVSAVSKVEGDDERKETEKKNDQTRAHIVDAAVVRIMKQRKELTHNLLITEVVNQLASRFKPDVPLVKKRIEDLIARDYLERMEDSSQSAYRYLA